MRALRRAWAEHRVLTLALIVALAVLVLTAVRFTAAWVYWSANRDAEIAGWMTLGYAARAHHVERQDLFAALEAELGLVRHRPEPIRDIAARTGMTEAEVVALVKATIETLKAGDGATE